MKLLFDPTIHNTINANKVMKTAYPGTSFTNHELSAIIRITNGLRRWVPKRERGKPIPENACLLSPMMMMSNIILTVCGYSSRCCRISPRISAGALHALPLTCNSLYEILCSKRPNCFDVTKDTGGKFIISCVGDARDYTSRMFGAFFSLDTIHFICDNYGIVFDDR